MLAGTIDHVGDRFRFEVLTRDRDLGDHRPYERVGREPVGKARCRYMGPEEISMLGLRRAIRSIAHDAIYLNSVFSAAFGVMPLMLRRMRLIPRVPVVLAPRGELDPGALALKRVKKRAYLVAARLLGLHRGVVWQASSSIERANIERWFGPGSRVVVARDLVERDVPGSANGRARKQPGSLHAVFLSRLSPKKNLIFALQVLSEVRGEVSLDVYGPIEDVSYWERCVQLIDRLPANVKVRYGGAVEHEQVDALLRGYDLLLLPTLGENYGCAILEALLAGCLVLISDRTPWRDLDQRGVGWDLPLSDRDRFRSIIETCCEMSAEEHERRSEVAQQWAARTRNDPRAVRQHAALFDALEA